MNIENRATKLYLKELAPLQALKLFDDYKLPTPYKEILTAVCVMRLKDFPAMDYLEEHHNIRLSYITFRRKTKQALEMFRKSHRLMTQN